jgi:hypothetical protein
MTHLTPPSNRANAAQTAPRLGLLTDGQDRSFLATSLAKPLGSRRQNKKSEPFETGTCQPTDPASGAPHLTSSPHGHHRNTFRKGTRLVFEPS